MLRDGCDVVVYWCSQNSNRGQLTWSRGFLSGWSLPEHAMGATSQRHSQGSPAKGPLQLNPRRAIHSACDNPAIEQESLPRYPFPVVIVMCLRLVRALPQPGQAEGGLQLATCQLHHQSTPSPSRIIPVTQRLHLAIYNHTCFEPRLSFDRTDTIFDTLRPCDPSTNHPQTTNRPRNPPPKSRHRHRRSLSPLNHPL